MEKILGSLSKGLVFVISAPAGTGKTTLVHMLLDEFSCICKSTSCTTRPPRHGEIPDKDYIFISNSEFEAKVQKGAFLEYAHLFNHSYGTLKETVEKEQNAGRHVILVIDTQGALQLKKKGVSATFIFISPPSIAELRVRLFKRKTEADEHIEERLSFAEKELSMIAHYDYHIINDNLHCAYDILRSIFIAEEHKKERYESRRLNE